MTGTRPTVLCVGLTTLDVVHHVSGPPAWGRKHRSGGGELVAGGPAANAAVTAARLLGSARLLTAIGATAVADPVRADLTAHHVEIVDLAPVGWSVPVASAIVDVHTGERLVVSPGAAAGAAQTTAGRPGDVLDGVAAVLLDGHHPVLAAAVAERAGRAGTPVVLDAGSWKDEVVRLLPFVELAACSADLRPPGGSRAGDDPLAAAAVLHDHGVPTVLVTDGARPVVWSTSGARGTVTVPALSAVDTLGAGDAFHGALVAALAAGITVAAELAALAATVAAVRCAHLGSRGWLADPTLDPVAARLRPAWRGR